MMGDEEGEEPHQHEGNTLCNKTNDMFELQNLKCIRWCADYIYNLSNAGVLGPLTRSIRAAVIS